MQEKNTSDLITFAVCFGIAVVFWVITNLSETYERKYEWAIELEETPIDQSVVLNSNTVEATIEVNGWKLLFTNFKDQVLTLNVAKELIDGSKNVNTSRLVSDNVGDLKIKKVFPTIISLANEQLNSKTVPVKLNFTEDLAHNHYLRDAVTFSPKEVKIVGANSVLEKIEMVETELFILSGKQNVEQNVNLENVANVKVEPAFIKITANIEEFTEKSIVTEIVAESEELDEENIVLLPNKATITCLIPLSEYDNVEEKDFKLVVDFNDLETEIAEINIVSQPNFVKNVQIEPRTVTTILYE